MVITTPLDVCIERVYNRQGHPTIAHKSEKASQIASFFAEQFFYPTVEEGFDKILPYDESLSSDDLNRLIFD